MKIKQQISTSVELDEILRDSFDMSVTEILSQKICDSVDDVFVGGSLVDGFWNAKSDVDIYAFTDQNPASDLEYDLGLGLPHARRKLNLGMRRVEITYLPDDFARVFGTYFCSYPQQDKPPLALNPEAMEILHRFSTGVPLTESSSFRQRQALIPRESLKAYFADVYLRRADSYLEDAVGALEEDDLINASSLTRMRLECVADSLLARAGETNTRAEKWRWKKIRRAFGEQSLLWSVLYRATFQPSNLLSEKQIRHFLAQANILLTEPLNARGAGE